MLARGFADDVDGLQPLNIEGARKLEALTERYEGSVAPDVSSAAVSA